MKQTIILGAGMAGIGAGLHLLKRGVDVTIIDQTEPGRETSYGNAGLIQTEAVEPYALPREISKLFMIATGISNDVYYEISNLPSHALSLLKYWWYSGPSQYREISKAYASIISRATAEHAPFVAEAGAEDLVAHDGFRTFYRDGREFEKGIANARRLLDTYGLGSTVMTGRQLMEAEPHIQISGAGAIHWPDTWAVRDPGSLVVAYADLFRKLGGKIVRGEAQTLAPSGSGWKVTTVDGPIEADSVVVALGPWSPTLLKSFGYDIQMVRKRGYHMHYRSETPLNVPLMDMANGYVLAPMLKGMRITTGAELTKEASLAAPVQLKRAHKAASEIIPLGSPVENAPWSGTRPCMPDMLPVIGEAPKHKGLWFHFGHGHQGFTLGPATGRMLAELMTGETPFTDATPFRPSRLF
ncbi:NAD(P)/FAD-dependent oxidoreductase [Rhizobium sp. C4]|uniref:NAD(P)/FAD-dependent oxidoreductase n=1 Tax=Rhizobium sp. C4 TaxID=1349800 RepID=UPI001E30ADE8|nr:FAD-binding oxidoreductase [Rhizobium sp. C4]MCD2174031.1 FAD-binding oxidoreductase [Rhizobium sp. C4]